MTVNVLTTEEKQKLQRAKLAFHQVIVLFYIFSSGLIFQELEIKLGGLGGRGFIVGFVVGHIALMGQDWTKTAVLACCKAHLKHLKLLPIILIALASVGFVASQLLKT